MKTTQRGRIAEDAAVEFLKDNGFRIIEMNWRRRICEVDVLARKGSVVYFVEVKYRQSKNQGGGLVYITPAKIKQLQKAVLLWSAENKWEGDCRLVGISVAPGPLGKPAIDNVVEINDIA